MTEKTREKCRRYQNITGKCCVWPPPSCKILEVCVKTCCQDHRSLTIFFYLNALLVTTFHPFPLGLTLYVRECLSTTKCAAVKTFCPSFCWKGARRSLQAPVSCNIFLLHSVRYEGSNLSEKINIQPSHCSLLECSKQWQSHLARCSISSLLLVRATHYGLCESPFPLHRAQYVT